MAFDVTRATGSGDFAVRVTIAGLPIEFVSDPAMEQTTADGRRRVYCLNALESGIVIEESVNIPECSLDGRGMSFRLFETRDEDVSQVLHRLPGMTRILASDLDAGDGTVTLLSASGVAAGDVLHIGSETIRVGAVAGPTLTGCNRGWWDTIDHKHWATSATGAPAAHVTDRPYRIRGRRAFVTLYDDGDDLQGNGHLAWVGEVASEPRITGAGNEFRLQLTSVAERLKQSIGGAVADPVSVRGVYYHYACPLWFRFVELDGVGGEIDKPLLFFGFFESNAEMMGNVDGSSPGSLNEALLDFETTWGYASTLRAVPDPLAPTKWTIEAQVPSGTTLSIYTWSPLDGGVNASATIDAAGNPSGTGTIYPLWITGGTDSAPPGAREVPRGFYGLPAFPHQSVPSLAATWPARRLYLASEIAADTTAVSIEWGNGINATYQIDSANASERYVELARRPGVPGAGREDPVEGTSIVYTRASAPAITVVRGLAAGSLTDLRAALLSESETYASLGLSPLLSNAHLDDWASAVTAGARGRHWLTNRIWILTQEVELLELLRAEWKLLGLYPYFTADGKIGLRELALPNSAQVPETSIDEEIVSVEYSTLSTGNQTVNIIKLLRGYDAVEDEHLEPPITIRDNFSLGLDNKPRRMEIAPKSFATYGDRLIGREDLVEQMLPVMALFGYPHDIVTVHVSYKLFDLLLGDVVSFSADHLPSRTTGSRGKGPLSGIIIARRWALADAHGTLTVLLSGLNVAGYTPTARVTGQTLVSGTTWDLAIDNALYAPAGRTVDEFWDPGDVVRLVEYDSESPAVVGGTVVSSAGGVIRLTLNSAWVPGSLVWELEYASYDEVQPSQRRFAFIAGADGLLGAAGDEPRMLAP